MKGKDEDLRLRRRSALGSRADRAIRAGAQMRAVG